MIIKRESCGIRCDVPGCENMVQGEFGDYYGALEDVIDWATCPIEATWHLDITRIGRQGEDDIIVINRAVCDAHDKFEPKAGVVETQGKA